MYNFLHLEKRKNLSEPWPLKPPCLAELGRVVGGTEVSCLDSYFIFLIYSFVSFRTFFFFLQRNFSYLFIISLFIIYSFLFFRYIIFSFIIYFFIKFK